MSVVILALGFEEEEMYIVLAAKGKLCVINLYFLIG